MVPTDGIPTTAPSRPEPPGAADDHGRHLRTKIDEFIGIAFYGELLKAMRNSPLKGEYGHGGRGEEVFAGQLHMELAQSAGRARSSPLTDAIYKELIEGTRRAARLADGQERQHDELMRTLNRSGPTRVAEETGSMAPRLDTLSLTGRR